MMEKSPPTTGKRRRPRKSVTATWPNPPRQDMSDRQLYRTPKMPSKEEKQKYAKGINVLSGKHDLSGQEDFFTLFCSEDMEILSIAILAESLDEGSRVEVETKTFDEEGVPTIETTPYGLQLGPNELEIPNKYRIGKGSTMVMRNTGPVSLWYTVRYRSK